MDQIRIIDLIVLAQILVVAAIATWLIRRYAVQRRFEQRLPWLSPSSAARHLQAVARERPVNYFALLFLALLGALSMVNDLSSSIVSPFLRYSTAGVVAAFALYLTRSGAPSTSTTRLT